jgi:hypothetical protein
VSLCVFRAPLQPELKAIETGDVPAYWRIEEECRRIMEGRPEAKAIETDDVPAWVGALRRSAEELWKEFGPNNGNYLRTLKATSESHTMKSFKATDSHSTSNWTKICQPQAMANPKSLYRSRKQKKSGIPENIPAHGKLVEMRCPNPSRRRFVDTSTR